MAYNPNKWECKVCNAIKIANNNLSRNAQTKRDNNPKTNKQIFRNTQSETKTITRQNGVTSLNSSKFYTQHLYLGPNDYDALIAHCFTELELDIVKNLPEILTQISNGKYKIINMQRRNYQTKIKNGVLHFVDYYFEIDGLRFVLSCEAIKRRGDWYVEEHPYSLKEERP